MTGATNQIHGTSYDQAPDWRLSALCRKFDPETWFPESNPGAKTYEADCQAAIEVCVECPVYASCLEWITAAERGRPAGSRFGIVAGLDPTERADRDPTAPKRQKDVPDPRPTMPEGWHPRREAGTPRGIARHEEEGVPLCALCASRARTIEAAAERRRIVAARHREGVKPHAIAGEVDRSYTWVITVLRELGLSSRVLRPVGDPLRDECGSERGFQLHRQRKEPNCRPCLDAHSAYETAREAARKAARAAEREAAERGAA